jgi:RNA polymerase sigma-70 factor, ECF subfamily
MDETSDRLLERMLVIRCQTGDEAALVQLVGRYQSRLGYFIWKMLGSRARVDDVLQDVWLDVLRGLPKLRDAGAFPAWAYRIARDRVYRELRRRGNSAVGLDVGVESIEDVEEESEFCEQDVALVHECLDELTSEHREVLVLRFLQGMSYEDTAEVACCEVGTVRSRLHYAKSALRRAIERKRRS